MERIIIGIILFVIILLIYLYKKSYKNNDEQNNMNNLFINKIKAENQVNNIPLNIYQTWATLDLPPKMRETVEELKATNPEFKHYLYDDNMCRDFIKEHFNKDVLYAFDKLKPGAYKADLFRYCMLYINGGIYLDIKYKCVNGFKLLYLTNKEYFVKDRLRNDEHGIYQALLSCYPYNNILLKCIHSIVNNVKNNYYILDDSGDLRITGPFLMNTFLTKKEIDNLELNIGFNNNNIYYNNVSILESYKEYRLEQKQDGTLHYNKLYKLIDIYNYYKLTNINTNKFDYNSCYIVNLNNNIIIIAENNKEFTKFELDRELNKVSDEISIKNNNIYNIKLFNYNNQIYYIGQINNKILNISCNIYDSNEMILNIIQPDFYKNMIDETTWSLFKYKDELAVVYSWYPLNICKMDINTKKINNIKYNYNLPKIFTNINYSTNGYNYNNQIWFVLQLHQTNNTNENFQHMFAVFDNDMNLIKYSELFKIDNSFNEKCTGIIIKDDNIILSYSIENNSYVSSYNINNNILWYKNEQEFSILI
uniref:Uncharacterized protein n=1 Tax=viral metagenome TaxID=1070528 RepID=A0A6C0HVQ3_9ZZZZ